jgi:hypothetical protein
VTGEGAAAKSVAELVPGFEAETDLERVLSRDPVILRGLAWGKPRRGHPEGTVSAHVRDLLATIELWGESGRRRSELRFLALVHDSLKSEVSQLRPKSGENHHAMRARRFAERYTDDERLLAVIELHDRPYNLWRRRPRRRTLDEREIERIIERVPDLDLFTRFLELDCSTEGKNPEPVRWFEEELESRGLRAPQPHSGAGP